MPLVSLKNTLSKVRGKVHFKVTKSKLIKLCVFLAFPIILFSVYPYLIVGNLTDGGYGLKTISFVYFIEIILYSVFIFLRIDFPEKVKRHMSYALLFIYPFICCLFVERMNLTYLVTRSSYTLQWLGNYLCYLMLFAPIYAICRRLSVTTAIAGGISVGFGIATYYTTEFRGSPILPWDIQSFGTAMGVAGEYTYGAFPSMAASLFALLIMISFATMILPNHKEESFRLKLTERIVASAVFVALFISILFTNLLESMEIEVWPWNQRVSTKITGVLGGFMGNMQFVLVDEPINYSGSTVDDMAEEIAELPELEPLGNPETMPTIITIMNESFVDYESIAINDTMIEEDYLPYIHSLMEQEGVLSGTAYSSVFGGNTCNSEYEYLTSNSTYFLPMGSIPYQQYVNTEQTSIISTLHSYGYTCNAIHPGRENAWNRQNAYEMLGFDSYTYYDNFDIRPQLLRGYTSDLSNYKQVVYEYEQHQKNNSNPLFIFNVTIQNHGGYDNKNYKSTVNIDLPVGYSQTEQYMSVANESDRAFEWLINYFENESEPVVILMFGDHWPNIIDDNDYFEYIMDISNFENSRGEDTMKKYQVPYLIWANYDLSNEDLGDMSLIYLKNQLLRAAGLEGTDYDNYLESLRDTLPVINSQGIIDKYGSAYTEGNKGPYADLLNDLYILQYNQTMDEEGKREEIFAIGD